jgi:protein-histidine pros-kinase
LKSEAQFRLVVESAPSAILMANEAGQIILVNFQAEQLFGYSRDELNGKSIEMLVPERFRAHHPANRRQFAASPHARPMGAGRDLYGLRKDQTEVPIEIALTPIKTDEGIFILSTIVDITERKIQEETRLKNIRLEEENRRIQEANRLKNEFVASMSHELRTPLNGIIGFSEFLIDEKAGPLVAAQKEYLNDVLNSGRHLLQLINNILDLAKIEAGKMELNREEFNVGAVVDEVCAGIKPTAQKKAITIERDLRDEAKPVLLDKQKFKQILFNLLSNAIKFTNEGGMVSVKVYIQDGTNLALEVHDNGIGIKKEDFHRIFQEFEQLDSSHSRRYEGTGLGLALVKKMVEIQNGRIEMRSEYGKGTTFVITLPFGDPVEEAPAT